MCKLRANALTWFYDYWSLQCSAGSDEHYSFVCEQREHYIQSEQACLRLAKEL